MKEKFISAYRWHFGVSRREAAKVYHLLMAEGDTERVRLTIALLDDYVKNFATED